MGTFKVDITIDAPVAAVWAVLGDIGSIHEWNPGVVNSYKTSDDVGKGSSRHCDLKGNSFLKEDVVKWIPNEALTMRIMDTNLPFKSADIQFVLKEESGMTLVSVSPVYQLKYGLLGEALDTLFVFNTYKKGMKALLKGLKRQVESKREKR